jgi:hypothetical protein
MRRVVLLAAVAVLVAGCGSGRVPVYPVTGRVTVEGKPAAGWIVALHLEPAPTGKYPHPLPRARVGEDGRFQFHTYESSDGAPAGIYKISFILMTEDGKDARQVYWPEPVQIRPESNELPPFDIK